MLVWLHSGHIKVNSPKQNRSPTPNTLSKDDLIYITLIQQHNTEDIVTEVKTKTDTDDNWVILTQSISPLTETISNNINSVLFSVKSSIMTGHDSHTWGRSLMGYKILNKYITIRSLTICQKDSSKELLPCQECYYTNETVQVDFKCWRINLSVTLEEEIPSEVHQSIQTYFVTLLLQQLSKYSTVFTVVNPKIILYSTVRTYSICCHLLQSTLLDGSLVPEL